MGTPKPELCPVCKKALAMWREIRKSERLIDQKECSRKLIASGENKRRCRESYLKHREKRAAYAKEYVKKNREKVTAYQRKYNRNKRTRPKEKP